MVNAVVTAAVVGGVVAILYFYILRRCGGALIRISLYASILVQAAMACALFAVSVVAGVFMALCACLTFVYVLWVRSRIEFAAAHLSAAADAVRTFPSLALAGIVLVSATLLWVVFWALAAMGLAHAAGDAGSSAAGLIVFAMLVSFYWGVTVFQNAMLFVTAAAVGHWWHTPQPAGAVGASLRRAFSTSFGSIALGSLIVAVIRALEAMARAAERRAREREGAAAAFLACCVRGLLASLGNLIEYFNSWAFVQTALTGASFARSGKEAWRLFQDRGWTAVVNEDLVGSALLIAGLMVAAVGAAAGGAVSYVAYANPVVAGIAAFLSFLAALAMAGVMSSIMAAAVRTVFVCFAASPAALASTHPDHLASLSAAWAKFHPAVWASCGYARMYPVTAVGQPLGGLV